MIVLNVSTLTPMSSTASVPPKPTSTPTATPSPPVAVVAAHPLLPTFLDYINGGTEMQLCVAIDFTGSNGDPRKLGTLHYLSPDGSTLNDYERAISATGGIFADNDSDKKFSIWGKFILFLFTFVLLFI
jgi:hypothetical protein